MTSSTVNAAPIPSAGPSSPATAADPVTVFTREFDAHPWSHIDFMKEHGPISPVRLPQGAPAWFVTDQALAKNLLADPRFGRDTRTLEQIFRKHNAIYFRGLAKDHEKSMDGNMLNRDAPDHMRLRKLAVKAFTPRTVTALQERITEVTRSLIAALPENETCDMSMLLSYPLPMTMICEILGVPEGTQRDEFKQWSKILFTFVENNDYSQLVWAQESLYDAISQLISQKRSELRTQEPRDLLDELILAHDDKDTLTDKELVAMGLILLIAGHETTVVLINNCIMRLALTDNLPNTLKNHPEKISSFIEEVLRMDPPARYTTIRFAKENFILNDIPIAKDDLFVVSLQAANYDSRNYLHPEEFNIDRNASNMSFGHGVHFCLGAALARQEAAAAVSQLVEKYSSISFVPPADNPNWRPNNMIGSRDQIPICLATTHEEHNPS